MTKLNASLMDAALAALGAVGGYLTGEEIECGPAQAVEVVE